MQELKQYTYEGRTFTYAALVIAGLDATFAVVQHVNMEAPVKLTKDRAEPEEPEIDTSACVRVIRFPPEAADGEHWVPVEISDNLGILQCIKAWALNAEIGDEMTLKLKTMTKREIEGLPSIRPASNADLDDSGMMSKDYIAVSLGETSEAIVTGRPLWSEVPAPRLPGIPPEMEKVADEYFRDALHQLTGKKPPKKFRFKPDSPLIDEQQDWCCMNVKPFWACGVSLLEAAEAFVVDAASNRNILSPNADYPAPFETKAREAKAKRKP